MKKVNFQFIFVSIALVLSIVAYCAMNSSVAWFSNNKTVNADGMSITTNIPDGINVTVTAHEIKGKSSSTLYFGTDSGSAALPLYDILDDVNRHVLLHFELTESRPITLSADTKATYFMDSEHPLLGTADGMGTSYNNSMSSIVSFKLVDATEATYNSRSAYSVTLPDTYLTFANENATTKEMDITPSLELASGDYTEFFILISYDEDHISRIYSDNIGNSVIQGNAGGDEVAGVIYFMDFEFKLSLKGDMS